MKKINFLVKLHREDKLELVEPSSEMATSYLDKSDSNLKASRILLAKDHIEESITLAYYSMYNALTALLFRTGIKCENHSAAIILLRELFSIDNSDISFAKKERIDKQYYVDFHVTREEARDLIEKAEAFNAILIDLISRISNEIIERTRVKLRHLAGLE